MSIRRGKAQTAKCTFLFVLRYRRTRFINLIYVLVALNRWWENLRTNWCLTFLWKFIFWGNGKFGRRCFSSLSFEELSFNLVHSPIFPRTRGPSITTCRQSDALSYKCQEKVVQLFLLQLWTCNFQFLWAHALNISVIVWEQLMIFCHVISQDRMSRIKLLSFVIEIFNWFYLRSRSSSHPNKLFRFPRCALFDCPALSACAEQRSCNCCQVLGP